MRWFAAILLLLLPLASMAAEPVGRLFFTPAQRATLDNARRQNIKINVETETPAFEIISVNGVVKRSDGESIVWINNKPMSDKQAVSGIKITPHRGDDARVNLQLQQSGREVDLRVGQNLDAVSGQILESYQQPVAAAVVEKKESVAEKKQPAAGVTEKTKSRTSLRKTDDEPIAESVAQPAEQPQAVPPPAPTQY
ncbi:MAG: hypothetical protein ACREUV_00245 [Burkholderiales bacterium]